MESKEFVIIIIFILFHIFSEDIHILHYTVLKIVHISAKIGDKIKLVSPNKKKNKSFAETLNIYFQEEPTTEYNSWTILTERPPYLELN